MTGDLTHRGRRREHERAAAFLRGLGKPLLVVPGNHDIPYTFPARFTRPWAEFERQWETVEPVFRSDEPDRRRAQLGAAVAPPVGRNPQVRRSRGTRELLAEAPESALRVVALHHHLIGAPWRSRKRPVARRSECSPALVDAGAELILAGHIHQAAVSERHEFEVDRDGLRGVDRLDRPRARPAAAEPARRGARPARLRGDRGLARSSRPTSGATTTGGSPRARHSPARHARRRLSRSRDGPAARPSWPRTPRR